MDSERPKCGLCGEPMPEGEEMFQYHGHSGPCPKKVEFVTDGEVVTGPSLASVTDEQLCRTADMAGNPLMWELAKRYREASVDKARIERLRDLAEDAINGLRYIRSVHGALYGVGWVRVEEKWASCIKHKDIIPPQVGGESP